MIVQIGSVIGSQIYRAYDAPYYYTGNKVLIAICALTLVVFILERQYLVYLNNNKEKKWNTMNVEDRTRYQEETQAREREGNRRLDFRFKY